MAFRVGTKIARFHRSVGEAGRGGGGKERGGKERLIATLAHTPL